MGTESVEINGTHQQQQQQSITAAAAPTTTTATSTTQATIAAAAAIVATSSSTLVTEDSTEQHQQQQQQQQQQQEQEIQQQQLQQQTMPAMPKEKAATAVSALNETNFAELNLKHLAVVKAMATTSMTAAARTRLQPQSQNLCGCGAASAMTNATSQTSLDSNTSSICRTCSNSSSNMNIYNNNNNSSSGGSSGSNSGGSSCSSNSGSNCSHSMFSRKFMAMNNTSPIAAAVASSSPTTTHDKRQQMTCCSRRQYWFHGANYQNEQKNTTAEAATTTTSTVAPSLTGTATATAEAEASTTAATVVTTTAPTATDSGAAAAAPVTPPRRSPNDFIFGRYIGEGSFSMVYMAVDIHTRKEYAIKVCEKRHILREHKQDYVRREREVMHAMTNVPGFVNLSCTFQDARSLYFVMTLAKKGDMLPYINKVGSFDVDCTRHYAAELLLACEHMHRRNIVHRDLKPENILFDENMHTMIADFGSSKIMTAKERTQAALRLAARSSDEDESEEQDDEDDDVDDVEVDDEEQSDEDAADTAGSDEVDSPRCRYQQISSSRARNTSSRNRQQQRYHRKRKGSFVGTAQYVSPEVLQNGPITPAADLWALGCIVYQMISGLPPFRGGNDYVIFKDILACKPDFPEGFDKDAEDLVKSLLKINPQERLGAQDEFGCYKAIRAHPFFNGIEWTSVRQQTPPTISPYLPGVCKEDELRSNYHVPEDFQPGLNDRQISRLLGLELGVASAEDDDDDVASNDSGGSLSTTTQWEPTVGGQLLKNLDYDLSPAQKAKLLEQQKTDKWHVFADGEVILKKGFINKRKGLFARKRMLLLTTGPRLIYIDPMHMIKKGEIPWSPELRVEAKNFKVFFVHTPNRTYYLDDPEGYSLDWVESIEKMRTLTYTTKKQQPQPTPAPTNSTSPPATKRTTSQHSLLSTSPSAAKSTTTTAVASSSTSTSAAAAAQASSSTSSSVRNVTGSYPGATASSSTTRSAAAF